MAAALCGILTLRLPDVEEVGGVAGAEQDHESGRLDRRRRRRALAPGGEVDRPAAELVNDLKRRGMLDDTLIVWGGEFGRTVYAQGGNKDDYGRDHHGRCFSMWMAGGGIKPGIVHGATDDFGYKAVENVITVQDFYATILHLLGLDHERLTFYYNGLERRLTDVDGAVVQDVLA